MSASARSRSPRSGASEHTEWRGAIAFANIGLPGIAVRSSKWKKTHRPTLLQQFTDLLLYNVGEPTQTPCKVVGLCLNEVGNLSDLLGYEERILFDDLIQEAFNMAGATEHGPARIFWSKGETISAWRQEQVVTNLSALTKMPRVDDWRTLDRLEVIGATKHGPCSLLVYNSHQPSSDLRKFPMEMRRRLCKATLTDAIEHIEKTDHNIGFAFGGDANCNLATWQTALEEMSEYKLTFQEAQLLWGAERKNGDLIVAAGINGFDMLDENCDVPNRDPQHNCMMLAWCYRARAPVSKPPLPARSSLDSTVKSLKTQAGRECAPEAPDAPAPGKSKASTHAPSSSSGKGGGRSFGEWWGGRRFGESIDIAGAAEHAGAASTDAAGAASTDTAGAAEHAENMATGAGQGNTAPDERQDVLHDIGFALAKSALLITALTGITPNCIDMAMSKELKGAFSEEDRTALEEAAQLFFCKKKSTGVAEHGSKFGVKPAASSKSALCLKSKAEISQAWQQIFERRRLQEVDDTVPINDPDVRTSMWNEWMNDFIQNELSHEQRQRRRNQQTSMFGAHIKNAVGGKHFLMALWQTGITWAPSSELVQTDYSGALEHVAKNFANWVRQVASSIRVHKEAPNTVEAIARSGKAWGQHGLTPDELENRRLRDQARKNYHWAVALNQSIVRQASGKGKGDASKPDGKGKGGASKHAGKRKGAPLASKTWDEVDKDGRWWLGQLWDGTLWQEMQDANAS